MRDKKIKSIDVVFENCEVAVLTPDMIEHLYIENIHRNISINSFQYVDGEVFESITCNEAVLEVNEKGLNLESGWHPDYMTKFEQRVKCNDITHLDIIYNDGTNEYISIPWGGNSDYVNACQQNIYGKNYNNDKVLFVVLSDIYIDREELAEKYGIDLN